jgi:CheY-like chemotaxis protein
MLCRDWLKSLRILVLDDEAPLRQMLEDLLRIKGIAVDSVATMDEALLMWQRELSGARRFHVALVDLSLGEGPGGREFAFQLRRMDPQARILACTGDATDPILDDPAVHGFDGSLAKPFMLDELLDELDKIRLDSRVAGKDRKIRTEAPAGCRNAPDNAKIGAGENL